MNAAWRYAAVAAIAGLAAALWPLTPALSARDAMPARVAAAAGALAACGVLFRLRGVRPAILIGLSALTAAAGLLLLQQHFNASAACVADYDGRKIVVGRRFNPELESYVAENPGLSPSDRLFDAGGVAERIWTAESIRSCRLLVSWAGLSVIPLLATCAAALIATRRHVFASAPAAVPGAAAGEPVYDAFISYRHLEPDRTYATEIVSVLEGRGLRVAIDVRDFSPNEHFLSEMERCIKQSRFVLCILTSQYLASDHTNEEAIIAKTLDMAERRRRLVPLVFERVELPVWLHGLVGIDFMPDGQIDPNERLLGVLTPRPASVDPARRRPV